LSIGCLFESAEQTERCRPDNFTALRGRFTLAGSILYKSSIAVFDGNWISNRICSAVVISISIQGGKVELIFNEKAVTRLRNFYVTQHTRLRGWSEQFWSRIHF